MKERIALSLVGLSVAIFMLTGSTLGHSIGGTPAAEAGAYSLSVVDQQCLGASAVRVSFNWGGYNEGSQWMDLSLSNNGFAPGTFVGVGPIPSYQTNFTWDGILPGLTHYVRVNTLTAYGWSPSPTFSFTTRNDCQYIPQVQLGQGASNLAIAQNCVNGMPQLAFTWYASNQGQQWIDNSMYSPYFEPGTFPSVGPLAPNQTSYALDGQVPGSLHFYRINTGTPYGWIGSAAVTQLIRTDCQAVQPPPIPTATVKPTN